jgi:AraC-like DNA-binding protein
MAFSLGAGSACPRPPDEWVASTRLADGVELFRARLRGRPFSRHGHDVYAIGVTEEGVQAFGYRGAVERSVPGQVFVLHPGEPHDGRAEGPGVFGYRQIYVGTDRIAGALQALTRRPGPLPFAPPVADDPFLARVIRAAFAATPEPLALDGLVLRLTRGLLLSSAGGRGGTMGCRVDLPAVERGRDFLRNRLTVVTSGEVEAITGLDRYQFARQFRAVYGTSPYRYSVMRRLDVARGWLRDARPLAETAIEAGFADQAHFTRTFKAAFGMTPGRYAKLLALSVTAGERRDPPWVPAAPRSSPVGTSAGQPRLCVPAEPVTVVGPPELEPCRVTTPLPGGCAGKLTQLGAGPLVSMPDILICPPDESAAITMMSPAGMPVASAVSDPSARLPLLLTVILPAGCGALGSDVIGAQPGSTGTMTTLSPSARSVAFAPVMPDI